MSFRPSTPRSCSRAALLLGALCGLWASPSPAAVYRCGQTYQQTPCPGGQVVDLPPGPSAAEVQAAQQRAAAEQQWVDGMASERQAGQASTVRQARHARKGATTTQPSAATAASQPTVSCPAVSVRTAGTVTVAEARRQRRAAARCGTLLPTYAALAASAPVKKKPDPAQQPRPASAPAGTTP
ncbi:hypothetical protein KGA65_11215 [Ideonella sp. B7]|uniref:hypothetical protein n=1 Tax=Ideonella benzenivorans TaxID=2831643 RepID=UPI001CED8739|nr:hypothetical protein [Ideonella benzenivorans]MCA6217110.1 hypothetical protein [Ideonella benzenivorans]